jgi:RHS repeat-associated protein
LVDGRRATTTYSLYRDRRLAAEADGTGRITAHYVYLDGKPVARIDMVPDDSFLSALWQRVRAIGSTATIYAIHTDHLGVPQAVTDAAQAIVWQARISPFGQARVVHASARADVGNAFEMNLRLPGQVYDAETGLHQNYFRDYDPALGRYTTPDPMGLAGGINPYLYVGDNPLTNVDPLGLYQSDIHYYMTFFLAMAAGIDYADARTIALATQYVDNNPATRPLDDSNLLTTMLSPLWNQNQLARYHFVLWEQSGNNQAVFSGDTDVTHHESTQLDRLFAASNNAPTQCAKLQFFGEYLHAFEDTFAHRNQNNVPYGVNNGFGHGLSAGSNPDYTYDDVYDGNDPIVRSRLWLVRSARTLEMEKEVFEKLSALPHSGTARSWAEVQETVKLFNAIQEHEGDGSGFRTKLTFLTTTLQNWHYMARDPDGSLRDIDLMTQDEDRYDETVGKTNREKNLCDRSGNRLRQEDYPGTILPETSCPR